MEFLFKHKLMALGIIAVVAGVAWYFLTGSSATPSDAVLTSDATTQIPPDAQQLVDSLSTLRAVSLDGTIFSNPSFQALHDFSTPIVPEPVGRSDPFAPLNAAEVASGASTTITARAPSH